MDAHSRPARSGGSRRRLVALGVVVALLPRLDDRAAGRFAGLFAHAASDPDPCDGPPHKYETWPGDILPDHPSTYSPPATLSSTSFVVLAAPRTASNSLVKSLNKDPRYEEVRQSPNVQMNAEVFDPRAVWGRIEAAGWTVATRDANRTEFMRQLFELDEFPAVPGARARGFKVFINQLSEDELRLLTRPKHVLKIVLRRQDTLSQYVSALRAGEVGFWGPPAKKSDETVAAFEDLRMPICVRDYESFLAAANSWYDWMIEESREHPESWLFISTEQLTSNPYTLAAVYAHLQVPMGHVLEYSPYTPDVLQEKVSNFDDIRDLQPAVDDKW